MATVLITFRHQTLITDPRLTERAVQINCFSTADPLQSKPLHQERLEFTVSVNSKGLILTFLRNFLHYITLRFLIMLVTTAS